MAQNWPVCRLLAMREYGSELTTQHAADYEWYYALLVVQTSNDDDGD